MQNILWLVLEGSQPQIFTYLSAVQPLMYLMSTSLDIKEILLRFAL